MLWNTGPLMRSSFHPSRDPFDWQNLPAASRHGVEPQVRQLRWWAVLAAFCSLLVHIGLISLFGDIRIILPVMRDIASPLFRIPPSEISQESLLPPAPDTDLPEKLESESVPQDIERDLDLLELQELIPDDREIKFTPEVQRPENIAEGGRPALAAEALESLDAAAFDEALESVSETAIAALAPSAPLSENQPAISADLETADAGLARDLLKKAAGKGKGIDDRFSTLEDLAGLPGGKLTDRSKPIFMPADLLFDYNEDRLREGARASLMLLGVLIERNPDTRFIIEGHTDTFGGVQSNLDLSRRRADAVRTWLQESLRLPPERLQVEAYGKSRPLVNPEGTIEDQQSNRRVEIRMLKASDPAQAPASESPPPAPAPEPPPAPPAAALSPPAPQPAAAAPPERLPEASLDDSSLPDVVPAAPALPVRPARPIALPDAGD
jgi:outer membrane protein OmpA-like peptidoglycan-associated protein